MFKKLFSISLLVLSAAACQGSLGYSVANPHAVVDWADTRSRIPVQYVGSEADYVTVENDKGRLWSSSSGIQPGEVLPVFIYGESFYGSQSTIFVKGWRKEGEGRRLVGFCHVTVQVYGGRYGSMNQSQPVVISRLAKLGERNQICR